VDGRAGGSVHAYGRLARDGLAVDTSRSHSQCGGYTHAKGDHEANRDDRSHDAQAEQLAEQIIKLGRRFAAILRAMSALPHLAGFAAVGPRARDAR